MLVLEIRSVKEEMEVIMVVQEHQAVYRLETLKEGPFPVHSKTCLGPLLQGDTKQARIKTDDYYIHIIM